MQWFNANAGNLGALAGVLVGIWLVSLFVEWAVFDRFMKNARKILIFSVPIATVSYLIFEAQKSNGAGTGLINPITIALFGVIVFLLRFVRAPKQVGDFEEFE